MHGHLHLFFSESAVTSRQFAWQEVNLQAAAAHMSALLKKGCPFQASWRELCTHRYSWYTAAFAFCSELARLCDWFAFLVAHRTFEEGDEVGNTYQLRAQMVRSVPSPHPRNRPSSHRRE